MTRVTQKSKIKKYFGRIKKLGSKTFEVWSLNDPWTLSAAISYYMIISLPAILVIILAITGYFYNEEVLRTEIKSQITVMMGQESARQVMNMIDKARLGSKSLIATIIGVVTLIFSATGVFLQLQRALNQIWDIRVKPKKAILKFVINRAFTLGTIIILGFLMLVSLLVSSLISIFSGFLTSYFDISVPFVFNAINVIATFAITALVFVLMFRILPDARVRWKYLWIGGSVTSVLFNAGIWLIGLYIGRSDPASTYGAAGSLVLILIWVAYSSLIFLLGAAFTRVYAERKDRVIITTGFAERIDKVPVEKEKNE
ncbi:MAG: YihY/virulence factor BrkB family protein [Bacteroidales bacterium]|nr:YihY/virulence factor BrkB family protein [Bacteroidales bacterium]